MYLLIRITNIIVELTLIYIDKFNSFVYNYKHKEEIAMSKKGATVLPKTLTILSQMGEQIKLARLRRNLSAELVSERADISRTTLWNVEKGNPSVSIGVYAAVLHALNNMDTDLLLIAKDDELGRKIQDLNLPYRKRSSNFNGE